MQINGKAFALICALTFTPTWVAASLRTNDDDGAIYPSDVMEELAVLEIAHSNARRVAKMLLLPKDYIARIEPINHNVVLGSLLRLNSRDARYMIDYHHCYPLHRSCLLISPYAVVEEDHEGRPQQEKVIMMLIAEEGHPIEPIGLVYLPSGDRLNVWNWLDGIASETKYSLERLLPDGRFIFPNFANL
ncbi:extracellular alpha-1,3-glucanase [Pseudozyma hubeiensis SY62]|uniref:Extracellular alpha-1,3-glucanase n=1 Tax=Pseudozyma hubeiensis (strain SY62) TaxID=1305764 RepID=R9P967_PSEHS|nr:extracellular alpha-1,3-glucanase [Pseudozyma hubeiensis SY62]GAC97928.1 extracellular alpha-1,3-glucanase [Pseudozyma hubeiensis SY62]